MFSLLRVKNMVGKCWAYCTRK